MRNMLYAMILLGLVVAVFVWFGGVQWARGVIGVRARGTYRRMGDVDVERVSSGRY